MLIIKADLIVDLEKKLLQSLPASFLMSRKIYNLVILGSTFRKFCEANKGVL